MVLEQAFSRFDVFTQGLACAALELRLQSILLFDASPDELRDAATQLASMLKALTRKPVTLSILGSLETEDSLWGNYAFRGELELHWQHGILGPSDDNSHLRIVLIPDLARLNLLAARACVMLVGAVTTNWERHGQSLSWVPNICWLAACSRSDVGQISPQLLDRFALRLPPSTNKHKQANRVEEVYTWAMGVRATASDKRAASSSNPLTRLDSHKVSPALLRLLRETRKHRVGISDEALSRIFQYFSDPLPGNTRREIALARLAVAYTRLEGAPSVTAQHVDAAASLIQLGSKSMKDKEVRSETIDSSNSPLAADKREPGTHSSEPSSLLTTAELIESEAVSPLLQSPASSESVPVHGPDTEISFPTTATAVPYPEDEAIPDRPANSLQMALWRYRSATATHGPIIGTARARDLLDTAIVPTILEAAKFQRTRRRNNSELGTNVVLLPTDLRRYRRLPLPEQMLLLLLDYTCMADCAWLDALLEHLRWAYIERARVCIIQVGNSTAENPLQAQQVVASSVLSPQITLALDGAPGSATPLAHGLDLATRALRTMTQHGRGAVKHVRLVVLSDGRGNVPLAASLANKINHLIGREGIEDALRIARSVPRTGRIDCFFLDPQPREHAELPLALAQALGAFYNPISPLPVPEYGN